MLYVRGPLSGHPAALAFAEQVHRVHKRYASEVVAANRLCPFLRDVETGFGAFVALLDPGEPSVEATVEAILAVKSPVTHVVFPLTKIEPTPFERFSGRLAVALKKELREPPVMATFHPELVGDASNAHRLVGLLRRAPDPFVQLIPEGMHAGGTVVMPLAALDGMHGMHGITAIQTDPEDTADVNFAKFTPASVENLLALIADIRRDRSESYASFLAAIS